MKQRCDWCEKDDLYREYHDNEWGVPVKDDTKMFEFLLLETFQAGLSWYTILKKRTHFKIAFDHFDYHKIAMYDDSKVMQLLKNEGIIRHQKKIEAAISNAQSFIKIQKEYGSFCNYIWGFTNHTTIQNSFSKMSEIPTYSEIAQKLSKDLKSKGFKFIGPTVVYAHMQATGMVNDHLTYCHKYKSLQ